MGNGVCLKCDGCGVEVSGLQGFHVYHMARAFGWDVPDSSGKEGPHTCPVCLEKAKTRVSSLVLPAHLAQPEKRVPKPKHKLFEETPATKHARMMGQLATHCRAAQQLVIDYFNPPEGLCWHGGPQSDWQVVICKKPASDAKPEGWTLPTKESEEE